MMKRGFRIRAPRAGWWAIALTVLCLGPMSTDADAQQQQVRRGEDVAERAIGQVRSPYCPGLMLEVCPSPEAGALRDSIRDLARSGMSEQELVEWMIAGHGEEWRAVPQRSGRGIFAWVIPPLFLLLGAGYVVTRLRRGGGPGSESGRVEPESTLSAEDRARLEGALDDLDREEAEV